MPSILEFLISPAEACRRSGPNDKIVFSSRVRLARNLRSVPFPGHARKADRVRAYEILMPVVQSLEAMAGDPFAEAMDKLTALDKQVLVERHLISREHAEAQGARGVAIAVMCRSRWRCATGEAWPATTTRRCLIRRVRGRVFRQCRSMPTTSG